MLVNDNEYLDIAAEIKAQIADGRGRALRAVNNELVVLYWSVGRIIDEHSEWGSRFVDNLSLDIRREYPDIRGFSVRNLKYMQRFARLFPDPHIVQAVLAQLTWYHNIALMDKVKDPDAYLWYARQAIENGWSRNVMAIHIERHLYERQAIAAKTTNFPARLPAPQSDLAAETLKDPYLFDFIEAREGMVEREIEAELVKNITALLLELGAGFAFIGEQYHLEVEGEDFYIDLLFYHLKLRCYVVIELKTGAFKPEFAGQINFYVAAIDRMVATDQDNPTIGILLCRDKRGLIAEYALSDIAKPIGVSEYQLIDTLPAKYENLLPSARDIEARIGLDLPDDADDLGAPVGTDDA